VLSPRGDCPCYVQSPHHHSLCDPMVSPGETSHAATESAWQRNRGAIQALGTSDALLAAVRLKKPSLAKRFGRFVRRTGFRFNRKPARELKPGRPTRPTVVVVSPPKVLPSDKKKKTKAVAFFEQNSVIAELFSRFDADQNGQLSFREACDCVRELNQTTGGPKSLTMAEIEKIFEEGDRDGDFRLSLDEFTKWCKGPLAAWLSRRADGALPDERASTGAASSAPGSSRGSIAESSKAVSRKPIDAAQSRAEVAKHLLRNCPAYSDERRKLLSDCYMQAVCGDCNGAAGVSRASKGAKQASYTRALSRGTLHDAQAGQGHIDKAKMTRAQFGTFCLHFNIGHPTMQDNLFRVCNPSSDGLITFEQLKRGVAPVITGDEEQQAAFYFSVYDADDSGELNMRELFEVLKSVQPDDPFSKDLVDLVTFLKPHRVNVVRYDLYLMHYGARKRRGELFPFLAKRLGLRPRVLSKTQVVRALSTYD